jgi:hypothetical protein
VKWEMNGGENLITLFYDKIKAIWIKRLLWIKHKAGKIIKT